MSEKFDNLTEETYEEYCERTRSEFTDEMMERAANQGEEKTMIGKETTVPGARVLITTQFTGSDPKIVVSSRESNPEDGSGDALLTLDIYDMDLDIAQNTLSACLMAVIKEQDKEDVQVTLRADKVESGAKALSKFFFVEDYDSLSPAERRTLKGYAKAVLDAADKTTEG